ncbi:MAG: TPP-dependent pyruvate/acetoin dehydrogenase alpha subunit [Verrucomicrobiales bacterium]|jgi:TPP-dependent pyruvate/acetoin dehydrogenase alpha subunit
MASSVTQTPTATSDDRRTKLFLATFRSMVYARAFEDKLASLYRAGKIVGGVYLGRGQEAYSAALAHQLRPGKDVYAPLIRDQAGRFAIGEPLLDAARTFLGSASGPMRGRDGNIHRGYPQKGTLAMISHLGAMLSVVNGTLLARRIRGELGDSVGATCIGDGGTSTGALHEALNAAAVDRLPVIIAVANNQFAYSTPNNQQFACKNLVDRAIGYGIEGHSLDATDLGACIDVFDHAVSRARAGHGPQLVVGSLLRLVGHGEHDDAPYITEEHRNAPGARDCISLARQQIIENGWMAEAELTALESTALRDVDSATATAQQEAAPDPNRETWAALSTTHLLEGNSQS